jgi:hypothetical protein
MLRIDNEGSMSDEKGLALLHTKPRRMRLDSMVHEKEVLNQRGLYPERKKPHPQPPVFFHP